MLFIKIFLGNNCIIGAQSFKVSTLDPITNDCNGWLLRFVISAL